ncbi:NAD(P)-dependent dehydrogenase (short-subunit alcohol dehydrogenase family) [Thermocatellispora tengchongensis]|uniref:NAD(P)-dependent dehydrogenase (Short-subunit alcohol dehydrogenase family) n=1 Tax=Thermocatellispora tengchongensis TaxID=1073253 RepID=A0A840PH87_9ACTN|nr:SDR family NAD(P)-dependent oxidoreductase [Thermocatellispora tengchongensis]MBB5138928.1 NAD(P)-dependent dehydrogenase (short-subunit alcohol dehydrogenase family) [Thermocatellispora tengchongensis]
MPSNAVLITGCSTGIGRATALALVRAGHPTWATARRVETLAELEDAGCRVLRLDVTDEQSRIGAVKAVEAVHGAVGVLVNNAGHGGGAPVEEVPLDRVREVFETNVFGLIRMCQLVLPGMRAQRHGTIVNLGSAAGLVTPPMGVPYTMTKYALESLSDALRLEVAPFGIRTVLIEPGAVRTRFMANSELDTGGHGPYAVLKKNIAAMVERAHREGARSVLTAEDVAKVIVAAIRARRPKARYRIGAQARLAPVVRRLAGDRGWDAAMRRVVPFRIDRPAS